LNAHIDICHAIDEGDDPDKAGPSRGNVFAKPKLKRALMLMDDAQSHPENNARGNE
jgi:hypothetical protein